MSLICRSFAMLGQAPADDGGTSRIVVILLLILLFVLVGLLLFFFSRYKRCPSNKVLVIYGKTGSGASKCIHGGAAFVWPLFQAYDYLDLEPFVVPIDLSNALSQENIRVTVPTTVTAAISNRPGIMENAAIRLLGLTRGQIQAQAQDIILGQMRAVLATMKIEDINRDRQAFMAAVNEAVTIELEKIGLAVINVNIRDIEDESGYIVALGRRAASEAVNQANVDVAEQEKRGQTGVAERQRDTRVAVASANANADIGEATADRNRRTEVAALDAGAVSAETEADSKKASYRANQSVAEQEARNRSESAAREADGAIRVAQENAEKEAEDARAMREQARLNAELVVPANANREKILIAADAQKQQSIRIAQGEAEALLAKMTAEANGVQRMIEGKAHGYRQLVEASRTPQAAAALLLIEKLTEVAAVQAKAIQDLQIDRLFIWDGGAGGGDSQTGIANLGRKLLGALPPIHDLAKQVGLELPEFLGRMTDPDAKKPADEAGDKPKPKPKPDAPAAKDE